MSSVALRCVSHDNKAGAYSGPALVLGSARCLFDDMQRVPFRDECALIATNLTGVLVPGVTHWASTHRELFAVARPLQQYLHERDVMTHTWRRIASHVDVLWDSDTAPDSSGCFGIMLAIALGYYPIIACGMPLDESGYYYHPYDAKRVDYKTTNEAWWILEAEQQGVVFSMSGWTKNWFGLPPGCVDNGE